MEAFEFLGVWQIPPTQTNAVAGTLTFSDQDGIYLTLMGSFKPIHEVQEIKNYPIILGITKDGKYVTLSECLEVQSQLGLGGSFYSNQRFRIQNAYVGVHFADPKEIRFHKMDIQYSNLPQWANLPLGEDKLILNEKGGLGRYEFTYIPSDDVLAKTTKGTITVTSSFQTKNDRLQELNMRQAVWVRVETQDTLSMEEWLFQFIGTLQNLLSFGTCRPIFLRDLRGYIHIQSNSPSDSQMEEYSVQIIFHQYYSETGASQKLHQHDMLFTLQDIKADFSGVIEKWLKVADELDSVCSLFFGIQRIERPYMEQKFLTTIQAVESYHRRRSSQKDLPEDKHQQRLEAILAGTPQEYKKWLADKLKYSNEPSLRLRLKDLLNDKQRNYAVAPLVGKKGTFIDRVVNARNFLTHYDPVGNKNVASGEELYHLTQILTFLLQSCFLHELGISPERGLDLFRRNALYQHWLSRKPQTAR